MKLEHHSLSVQGNVTTAPARMTHSSVSTGEPSSYTIHVSKARESHGDNKHFGKGYTSGVISCLSSDQNPEEDFTHEKRSSCKRCFYEGFYHKHMSFIHHYLLYYVYIYIIQVASRNEHDIKD